VTPSARPQRAVALVPPQHGAWAFLGLPLVAGLAVAPWTPVLLLLAITWIVAYPLSYFLLALAKDAASRHPHPKRFTRPIAVWSLVAVPAAIALVVLRPWLIWIGALYLVGFAVNIAFARRRDDRALVNDAVFIVECAAMVPVTWAVGVGTTGWALPDFSQAPKQTWLLTIAVALLLAGSTLHVKSLIRERANPGFTRLSQTYAVVALAASILLAWAWGLPSGLFLVLPFAWCVGRSVAMAGTSPSPPRIGMVELVGFCLLGLPALVLA
jgi:hypothetical protein